MNTRRRLTGSPCLGLHSVLVLSSTADALPYGEEGEDEGNNKQKRADGGHLVIKRPSGTRERERLGGWERTMAETLTALPWLE